jgi:glutathione S-transferase
LCPKTSRQRDLLPSFFGKNPSSIIGRTHHYIFCIAFALSSRYNSLAPHFSHSCLIDCRYRSLANLRFPIMSSSGASAEYRICAVVTVLVFLLNTRSGIAVGDARKRFKIPLPKTTGDAEFERIFRAHANNAEQYPQFLALMWVFAVFVNGIVAGCMGVVWLILRNQYVTRYHTTAENLQMFTVPSYFVLIFYSFGIVLIVVYNSVADYL